MQDGSAAAGSSSGGQQVELGALVAEAVEDIRPQFESHRRILYFSPPRTDLLLYGDATRLTR